MEGPRLRRGQRSFDKKAFLQSFYELERGMDRKKQSKTSKSAPPISSIGPVVSDDVVDDDNDDDDDGDGGGGGGGGASVMMMMTMLMLKTSFNIAPA